MTRSSGAANKIREHYLHMIFCEFKKKYGIKGEMSRSEIKKWLKEDENVEKFCEKNNIEKNFSAFGKYDESRKNRIRELKRKFLQSALMRMGNKK